MLKVILLGGLVVSLVTFFQHGGFQNRGTAGSQRRPGTRYGPPGYGPPGALSEESSSTEPYFRIILSSNASVKSTASKPTVNETVTLNSTVSTTIIYENSTSPAPRDLIIQQGSTTMSSSLGLKSSTSTTIAPQSSVVLVESTTEQSPKVTTKRTASTFVYENTTSILTSTTTQSSLLVESTNENVPGSSTTSGVSPIAQSYIGLTQPAKIIVETVTEAGYPFDDSANEDNEFRSRPLNHVIPPPTTSPFKFNEDVSIDSRNNNTANLGNISIPPAYYLPPRVRQFPSN